MKVLIGPGDVLASVRCRRDVGLVQLVLDQCVGLKHRSQARRDVAVRLQAVWRLGPHLGSAGGTDWCVGPDW